MYIEKEFKHIASTIPQDFGPKTFEFWSFVEDKIEAFVGKIQMVYRDEICEDGEKALAHLSTIDDENFLIVKKLNRCAKVIKVCRFDPTDYLRSWQIQLERKP